MNKAKRYNQGKVDHTLHYVPALEAEARVWMFGEEKYGRDNWQQLWGEDTRNVVSASALRHLFAIMNGEDYDEESGLPHAAHVRCNMAMLIKALEDSEKRIDKSNRPAPVTPTCLVPPGSYIKDRV